MTICVVSAKSLPKPRYRYSQIIKAGPHYYVSGLLGLDEQGELVEGGVGAETARIMSMLPALLDEFDMIWENLVFARIYCADFARFDEVNRAWEETFTTEMHPPARSAVGVSALPMGASVEIEFTLYREW